MVGYKLFRQRKDGSLGPLFINARQRIEPGVWYEAGTHPTKGYAVRHGWHAALAPHAPHLSTRGRVWAKVALEGVTLYERPLSQGGVWALAERMKVIEVMP